MDYTTIYCVSMNMVGHGACAVGCGLLAAGRIAQGAGCGAGCGLWPVAFDLGCGLCVVLWAVLWAVGGGLRAAGCGLARGVCHVNSMFKIAPGATTLRSVSYVPKIS